MKIPKNLEVRHVSEEVGYGVFTTAPLKKNTVVEICYCIVYERTNVNWVLNDYLFNTHMNSKNVFLPLGYGAIYNHHTSPNIVIKYSEDTPNFVKFVALRDIKKNEELVHDYGDKYWETRKKRII